MIRERLKAATHEVHERLHGHDGFAAAAAGTISTPDYRDLLARLYGFHAAFDAEMARAPGSLVIELPARARAELLAQDLAGLGVPRDALARLPLADMPPMRGESEILGGLYVVEGSTMGGVLIARALVGFGDNRRFYLGHGADHSRLWRLFLARLETAEAEPAARAAAAVFSAFEDWMRDWRGSLREAA